MVASEGLVNPSARSGIRSMLLDDSMIVFWDGLMRLKCITTSDHSARCRDHGQDGLCAFSQSLSSGRSIKLTVVASETLSWSEYEVLEVAGCVAGRNEAVTFHNQPVGNV